MWKRGTKKRWRRLCAKPNFISSKIFNKDLEDVNLRKSNVVLYRLGIAYFFTLNLAKLPRFEVNYDFIKSANREKATLCLQTRIAFAMISKTDFYQNMFHKTLFDTSFFLIHFLFSITSAKVLGKIKDDCRGKPVEEFIGLRSMLYSFFNDDMEKTVKGVKHICNWQTLKTTGL